MTLPRGHVGGPIAEQLALRGYQLVAVHLGDPGVEPVRVHRQQPDTRELVGVETPQAPDVAPLVGGQGALFRPDPGEAVPLGGVARRVVRLQDLALQRAG